MNAPSNKSSYDPASSETTMTLESLLRSGARYQASNLSALGCLPPALAFGPQYIRQECIEASLIGMDAGEPIELADRLQAILREALALVDQDLAHSRLPHRQQGMASMLHMNTQPHEEHEDSPQSKQ